VTDVVLPQMNGRELAGRLTGLRPGLRVLYISGYADEKVFRRGVVEEGMDFLQKPFQEDVLARKVREVLDR
jgi:FixJ family two-component response regulator